MSIKLPSFAVVVLLSSLAPGQVGVSNSPGLPPSVTIPAHRATSHPAKQGKSNPSPPPPTSPQITTTTTLPAPTPLRPSQLPAVPPRISYQNGQLTVVAENSTVADILNAIHNATGAQIETAGAPATERVAAKIGPGSVRDVLLSVLQGSRYDYILVGSANNPDQIERVILTPRSGATGATAGGGSTQAVGASTPKPGIAVEDEGDAEGQEGFATPNPAQQLPGQLATPAQPGVAPNAQSPTTTPGQNVKTPEQLLEDLRRMEQERRSQQPGAQDPRQRGDRPPQE